MRPREENTTTTTTTTSKKNNDGGGGGGGGGGSNQRSSAALKNFEKITKEEKEKLISDVVRYALFMDAQKQPLKKQDIKKHILKDYGNITAAVIDIANKRLKEVFGFELVEVWRMVTTKEGRVTRKKAAGTYVIKNSLQEEEDAMMTQLSGNQQFSSFWEEKDDDVIKKKILLAFILAFLFITKSGLERDQLFKLISQVFTEEKEWIENTIDKEFVNQLYLEKVKLPGDGKQQLIYYMGPRSEIEFGKVNILKFVSQIFDQEVDPILLHEVQLEVAAEQSDAKSTAEVDDEEESQVVTTTTTTTTGGRNGSGSRGRGGSGRRGAGKKRKTVSQVVREFDDDDEADDNDETQSSQSSRGRKGRRGGRVR